MPQSNDESKLDMGNDLKWKYAVRKHKTLFIAIFRESTLRVMN